MNAHLDNAATVFDGARFTVRALELDRRDGGVMRREVVVPSDAVVILPLLDERTVVMIRNERFAVGQTLWELPAGTIEAGEDPDACAARELVEETGYAAGEIERLTSFYPSPGFCTELLTAYRATGLTHEGQNLDETERITPEILPIQDVMTMIRDNVIRDAKTIATLLFHVSLGAADKR